MTFHDGKRERWQAVRSNGAFEVSDLGNIREVKSGARIPQIAGTVKLRGEIVSLGFIVLYAFRTRPTGHVIEFIDGDATNCKLENLRWRYRSDAPAEVLTEIEKIAVRRRAALGETVAELAECFEVAPFVIRRALS